MPNYALLQFIWDILENGCHGNHLSNIRLFWLATLCCLVMIYHRTKFHAFRIVNSTIITTFVTYQLDKYTINGYMYNTYYYVNETDKSWILTIKPI